MALIYNWLHQDKSNFDHWNYRNRRHQCRQEKHGQSLRYKVSTCISKNNHKLIPSNY